MSCEAEENISELSLEKKKCLSVIRGQAELSVSR